MASVETERLNLDKEQWEFTKKMMVERMNRGYDLEYLKLTVIIVLIIVIIFYITCKFNSRSELYSDPQLSAATGEQKRSDPAFDVVW